MNGYGPGPDGIALPVKRLGDPQHEPPTSADAAGRYAFAEAGEGKAWLRIEGSGWGAEAREIEVPSSGRLRVDFPLGAVELRARLVDATGVPVSPGHLGVYGDGGLRRASSSVDSEGVAAFYLDSAAKARYLGGTDNGLRRGYTLLSERDVTGGERPGDDRMGREDDEADSSRVWPRESLGWDHGGGAARGARGDGAPTG